LAQRYKGISDNVQILYNVWHKKIDLNETNIRDLKNTYDGRRLLIYIGGLERKKGLFKLADVLLLVKKDFPDAFLLLIGDYDSSHDKDKFLEYIREKDIESYLEIHPWLPFEKMFEYLNIAHVALAPHQHGASFEAVGKGSGRKFFTYMHSGLPIVATNLGEIAQVVEEENCGLLVDTTSEHAIFDAIKYLFNNQKLALEMGENGKRAVIEKYNWEKESVKLLNVYHNALSSQ
jgi:glycosyltransferase involved in cell wall biosynthesis